jgi:FAD/FMN-containing dehydrogenase
VNLIAMPDSAVLLESLRAIVGHEHVLADEALVVAYVTDWTRRYSGPCVSVVRPSTTEEVSQILALCCSVGQPVLIQGGNTGLVGGSVPSDSSMAPVVISMRRLSALSAVDGLTGQITAGAGALLSSVQAAAASAGWIYGIDLAARDSATIGGTVATNAGGMNVIAYGMTRAQVVGIEAVLADGTVIAHLGGLLKDNTGFDLAALLCGSEGTLAVITAVRLRLHRPPARTSLAMVGCNTYSDALELMSAAAGQSQLIAAEVVDATGISLVDSVLGLTSPLASSWPVVAFLEVADGGDATGLECTLDRDAVVALEATDQARLWAFRERQSEVYATLGVVHKLDVSIPLARMQEVLDSLSALLRDDPAVEIFGFFGHIADGNIHVEFTGPQADDTRVDHLLLEHVAAVEGSISAEHGIGRMKVDSLHLVRSAAEIAAMRAIKTAWDPTGILNRGILFP